MFWFQKHHPDVVYMDIRQEHGDIHWNECQIRVNEVLKLMDTTPLFGNRRGDTHWLVFTKEGCQNEEIS